MLRFFHPRNLKITTFASYPGRSLQTGVLALNQTTMKKSIQFYLTLSKEEKTDFIVDIALQLVIILAVSGLALTFIL